jgi:PAS domain S-box-containing protein
MCTLGRDQNNKMRKLNQGEEYAGEPSGICDEGHDVNISIADAKYRSLVESSMDAILLTVPDGRILEANAAACKIFRMTPEEICHAGRADLVDMDDPRLAPLIEERIRTGKAKGEITCKRKDGSLFPAEISSMIFTDANGEERTSMTISDITDRKLAEEKLMTTSAELQKALANLNNLMDSSQDIICTASEEGRFIHVSAASERIWGYKPAELAGRSILDFVYPDDQEITLRTKQEIRNGLPVTMFENRFIHKDGSVVPIIWSSRWDEKDKILYGIAKDATEKRKLEKAFETERQRFLNLYSQSPSCMGILKGPDHIYEMANPLYLQLVGRNDIIGKPVREALPEVEAQGVLEFLNAVYTTGETFFANEMLIRFDRHGTGELVDSYLNFICQAHRDHEGLIDGIFFFAIDVTEQVLSRRKIEESEKRYRRIVETAMEGIWMIDEHRHTTFVNPQMAAMLGYTVAEMLGKDMFLFMDEEGIMIANLLLNRQQGVTDERAIKYISKCGKLVWTNISAKPLVNESGLYQGCLAMITDITERIVIEKELENKQSNLNQAQSIAQLGNWAINLADDSQVWSDELYRLFGIDKEEVMPSTGLFLSVIHPDDLSYACLQMEQATRTLNNSSFEFRYFRKDGTLRYGYSEWQFILDKDVQPVELLGIVQDITDRRHAEAERTKLINDLTLRNRDLEQFGYIISHNLRAPVANILGIENILYDPELSNDDRLMLRKGLHESVVGLDNIVKDLSQILQVKDEIHGTKERVQFSVLVENVRISLQNLIVGDFDIEIRADFSELDEFLCLKSFMYSIFYNLIFNSIKYRRQDIRAIIVITSRRLDDGFELIFSDNGMGFDLEKQGDQVFGLYKRFHANIEGRGMGLYMVKKQVEALGGKIRLKSELNRGSEFTLEFGGIEN